jgi:hypothetical protein
MNHYHERYYELFGVGLRAYCMRQDNGTGIGVQFLFFGVFSFSLNVCLNPSSFGAVQ